MDLLPVKRLPKPESTLLVASAVHLFFIPFFVFTGPCETYINILKTA